MRDSIQKDLALMDLKDIVNGDEAESKSIIKQAQVNYQMMIEIYHWLQSRSKLYPWIDNNTFRVSFIKKLKIINISEGFNMSKFEVLLAQAQSSNRDKNKNGDIALPNGICRYQFLELILRTAKFLYSTKEIQSKKAVYAMGINQDLSETVTISRAFFMLIKDKIVPFYQAERIS